MRCWFQCIGVPGAMAAALAFIVAGRHAGLSVSAGVVIALLNFWALRGIVGILSDAAATGHRGGLGFFIVPKTLALFGVVWLLLAGHLVTAGPLALGYAALPMGVAIGAMVCNKAA